MTNKEKARVYFNAVNRYDESTIKQMVDKDYIQHNPFVPTGRAAFLTLLPKLKEHGSKIENVRILQDGPYVIMHHLWRNAIPFGKQEMVAFHIIRFGQDGLITEHWSVMMEFTGRSVIDGETEIRDLDKTEKNKAVVTELFDGANNFFSSNNSLLREETSERRSAIVYGKQHKVFGEGNFGISICEGTIRGTPSAIYDLFRLEDGLIAEHWRIHQNIPQENVANSNTMFNF